MPEAENEGTPLHPMRLNAQPNSNIEEGLVGRGRLGKCIYSTVFFLFFLALYNGISVAGIIIGSFYLDKSFCPGKKK